MNIKQAEDLSGVSRQNIRFYEREGLLYPDRNPENDYREYTQEHILALKHIRMMRMLDMPLDRIRLVLQGKLSLSEAAREQELQLKKKQEKLNAAIRFCGEIKEISALEEMDVDMVLSKMTAPEAQESMFQNWLSDYRKVVLSEREKTFSFVPETAVTNAKEFTDALFTYADENDLNLVLTKESMYPEFTINGIEYTAERFYGSVSRVPTAIIRCTVKYPEDFEPDVPEQRKKYMKLLNLSWILIPCILVFLPLMIQMVKSGIFASWEGWVLLIMIVALIGAKSILDWIYHFNEKHK